MHALQPERIGKSIRYFFLRVTTNRYVLLRTIIFSVPELNCNETFIFGTKQKLEQNHFCSVTLLRSAALSKYCVNKADLILLFKLIYRQIESLN